MCFALQSWTKEDQEQDRRQCKKRKYKQYYQRNKQHLLKSRQRQYQQNKQQLLEAPAGVGGVAEALTAGGARPQDFGVEEGVHPDRARSGVQAPAVVT